MKSKISTYMKVILLVFMVTAGFAAIYSIVWVAASLPVTTWASVLVAVASILSALGLFAWIWKEDHVPVRCQSCRYWVRHEPGQEFGTCFRRGFMHGVDKRENGYCDRGELREKKNRV